MDKIGDILEWLSKTLGVSLMFFILGIFFSVSGIYFLRTGERFLGLPPILILLIGILLFYVWYKIANDSKKKFNRTRDDLEKRTATVLGEFHNFLTECGQNNKIWDKPELKWHTAKNFDEAMGKFHQPLYDVLAIIRNWRFR